MKYLGIEGIQAVLGGILETRYYFQNLLNQYDDMVCVDPNNTGFISLFRIYPTGTDASAEYQKEVSDPAYRAQLIKYNELTGAIGEKMFEWYLAKKQINGKYTPHMAYSTGFRTASYNGDGADDQAMIYALKVYPMNVFVCPEDMQHVIDCIRAARDEVMKDM